MDSCRLSDDGNGWARSAGGRAATPPTPNFTLAWHPDLAFNVWPGDFNEDGRTDLVAAVTGGAGPFVTGPGRHRRRHRQWERHFQRPSPVGAFGYPLNVADFNADGFVDIVVLSEGELQVLAGNGDGTFDPPRVIDSNEQLVETSRVGPRRRLRR